ncbi:Replication-associated recombination protein RarA [hydrothermal vent metagenome]|uniref:Replication-associated recombination protein RarA n=1 Tax=hydrothermal vent metagenome TaxID=652676 RepID=A0A3B0XU96_9ZZZZ
MTNSPQSKNTNYQPLAEQLRPVQLDQVFGQQHLLSDGKPLAEMLRSGHLHSMILWGPPGTGKTTLARMLAKVTDAEFIAISAVLAGVADIREAIKQAQQNRDLYQRNTVLFIDEVHRFNKSQQDAFLPYVEDGTVVFVGATTENPSFEVNNALLSRTRVYPLHRLDNEALHTALQRATNHFADKAVEVILEEGVDQLLVDAADGDARRLFNLFDIACTLAPAQESEKNSRQEPKNAQASVIDTTQNTIIITQQLAANTLTGSTRSFDNKGDIFYEQISALHKSIRGSAPDAALYWLARMIDGGCDPLYIARRLVRMAGEDIGNADPRAMTISLDAWQTVERLGQPEGDLALAQAVSYLACAPKSNAVYMAFKAAMQAAQQSGSLEVPMSLRNAPSSMMKEMGYGSEYRYAHDEPNAYAAGENYFPEQLIGSRYYFPVDRGLEIKIGEKLAYLRSLDKKAGGK